MVDEAELLVEAGEADEADAGPVEEAELLVEAGDPDEADEVDASLVELVVALSPTVADTRPPPVPPAPRDTPPLPRDTPTRGSPLELVVVKVTSEDVDELGLCVMVELLPGVVELAVWLAPLPEELVDAPSPTVADTRPPLVPPTPSDTPPLPRDTPIRGSPLELVVVKVVSDADELRLGLWVMVELLPSAVVEAGVVEVVESDPPIPTDATPLVPPTPRETPPLPSDTPISGSPLELVVVKVTSDADVDWLGLEVIVESGPTLADTRLLTPSVTPPLPRETPRIGWPLEFVVVKVTSEADVDELGLDVMVESPPRPTLADARLLTPSVTPPLPRDTPRIGSPLEFVVVKVTSEAEEVTLGLEVMVESPKPTLADARLLTPSVTPPSPREIPIIGSPLELVVVKVVSEAVVVLGLEVMVESPRPTLADTRVLTPSVTPPSPREMPRIGSPLELVVVKVVSDAVEAVVVLGLEVMVESPRPTLADTRVLTPSVTPPSPREMPMIGSPLELVVVNVTSEAVVEVLGLCVIVEFALLLIVAEAAEEDELLVLPIGSASEPALDVEEAGAVEFALLLIVPALAEELEVMAEELVVAGAEELVEFALLLIGPALADELVVAGTEELVELALLLIGPALLPVELVAGAEELVELALLLIGPALLPVELVAGAEELVELALLLIGPALLPVELVAGAEELVELALLLMVPALAVELLVLLIGPAVASPFDVVEFALLLIGPPVEAPLEVGPADVVEFALLVIGPAVAVPLKVDELMVELALLVMGPALAVPLCEVMVEFALLLAEPLAVGIMEEVMFPLMVDERVGLIGPAVAVLFALLLAEPLAVGIMEVALTLLLTEPLAVGIIDEVMFPLIVDERLGLIGPAVAVLLALLLAEPLAVGIIEVTLALLLTEPLAVGIIDEVMFPLMLMVEERV